MKRVAVMLALILTVLVLGVSVCAFGESNDTYFINPTSVEIMGNYLFVADNISETKCAIICFDVSDGYVYKSTYTAEGRIDKLSVVNGRLFAVMQDKTLVLSNNDGELTLDENRNNTTTKAVDYTYYDGKTLEYFITATDVRYSNRRLESVSNGKACLVVDDNIYYLYGGKCNTKHVDENAFTELDDAFNDNSLVGMTNPIGMFLYSKVDIGFVIFDNKTAIYLKQLKNADDSYRFEAVSLESFTAEENTNIIDITANANGDLFVLYDSQQVKRYLNNNLSTAVDTLGSDTVTSKTCPESYTSFTLARSKGYPTNVIYKTNGANSIEDLKKDYDGEYIILGFDGDNESAYYYVYIDGKFGWVKKSDNVAETEIEVIDTTFSSEATYKFNSLNAVYVYKLPSLAFPVETINQTADDMQDIVILQRFVNGGTTWYYVSYEDGAKHGFVLASSATTISVKSYNETAIVGIRIINSTLGEAVKMYATGSCNEGEEVCDSKGKVIKLRSRDKINVVKYSADEKHAYVRIEEKDGTKQYGWIDASTVAEVDDTTTNVIVGLSLLGVAVAGIVVLVVFLVKRKNKIEKNV